MRHCKQCPQLSLGTLWCPGKSPDHICFKTIGSLHWYHGQTLKRIRRSNGHRRFKVRVRDNARHVTRLGLVQHDTPVPCPTESRGQRASGHSECLYPILVSPEAAWTSPVHKSFALQVRESRAELVGIQDQRRQVQIVLPDLQKRPQLWGRDQDKRKKNQ